MSHADMADKLLIKPAAGARPAPPRTRRQIIPKARTRRSDDVPVRVERIPVDGRENGVLTELAGVDLDRRPLSSVRRDAIGHGGHGKTVAVVAASVNLEYRLGARRAR